MLLSPTALVRLRTVAMGLAGLVALGYALSVLLTGRLDLVSPWLPVAAGLGAAVLVAAAAFATAEGGVAQAMDELYRAENGRALAIGYWSAIVIYLVFGGLVAAGTLAAGLALPAMATLTGAAYLIPYAWLTGRHW
ncbi:MAG: hypothetical protein AAFW69_06080 [Pseudomonadota bacterium]